MQFRFSVEAVHKILI